MCLLPSATPDEISRPEARSLATLRQVAYLSGYAPGTNVIPGRKYDVRFLDDHLIVVPFQRRPVLVTILGPSTGPVAAPCPFQTPPLNP